MNKQTRITHFLLTGLLLAGLSTAQPAMARERSAPEAGNGIAFKLSEASGVYTVYMKPNATPAAPNATVSAQVTIKVPHGATAPTEIMPLVAGTAWELTSRNNAPPEAPGSDYLSFSLDFPAGDYRAFNWAVNTEQAVFTFKTAAGGHLMDNCDAFAPPNSQSASVGNEIAVLGFGDGTASAYAGNYDQTADCPLPADAVSSVGLVARSSVTGSVPAGSLITYTFDISNTGLRSASNLTLRVALTGLANMQSASNSLGVANPELLANQSATWHLGELPPDEQGTVTVTMLAPASNDTLTTTATISASNDSSPQDNNAQLVVAVLASAPQPTGSKVYLPVVQR